MAVLQLQSFRDAFNLITFLCKCALIFFLFSVGFPSRLPLFFKITLFLSLALSFLFSFSFYRKGDSIPPWRTPYHPLFLSPLLVCLSLSLAALLSKSPSFSHPSFPFFSLLPCKGHLCPQGIPVCSWSSVRE